MVLRQWKKASSQPNLKSKQRLGLAARMKLGGEMTSATSTGSLGQWSLSNSNKRSHRLQIPKHDLIHRTVLTNTDKQINGFKQHKPSPFMGIVHRKKLMMIGRLSTCNCKIYTIDFPGWKLRDPQRLASATATVSLWQWSLPGGHTACQSPCVSSSTVESRWPHVWLSLNLNRFSFLVGS